MTTPLRVDQFLKQFVRWAAGQGNVEAVALVGSHARGTASETSDVDLVILARQPGLYLSEPAWTHTFGEIVNQRSEDYGRLIALRTVYADGLEVEFGLTGAGWAAAPLDEGTRDVVSRGMQVLLDREGVFRRTRIVRETGRFKRSVNGGRRKDM